MNLLEDNIRRYSIYHGIIFVVASVVFVIIVWVTGVPSDVKDCYFVYANKMMEGVMPYTPGLGLSWEYPPFSYVFMFIPRIFSSSATGYEIAFVAEVAVFFMFGIWIVGKMAVKLERSPYLAMLIYSIFMMAMFEFLTDRFDIFPAIMTLFAVYLFFFTDRKWAAFVILTIAAATKLYPALLIPLFVILLVSDKKWKDTATGLALILVTAGAIMLPFILADVQFMMFLDYNVNRPMEVECLASSLIMFASMLGLTQSYVGFDYGSDNLYGSWADAICPYMTWISLIVIISIYVFFALYVKKSRTQSFDGGLKLTAIFGFLIILSFFLFGKVLSSQYLVWLMPFVFLIMMVFPKEYSVRSRLFQCFLASEIFTQMNFAINYGLRDKGEDLSDIGIIVLLVRNILLVVCFILALRILSREIGPFKDMLKE